MQCPKCNHEFQPQAKGAAPSGDRVNLPDGFDKLCEELSKNPKCKEEWKKPLSDWPRFNDVSDKQWKFFAVIHKECLGKWPARPEIEAKKEDFEVPF